MWLALQLFDKYQLFYSARQVSTDALAVVHPVGAEICSAEWQVFDSGSGPLAM